MMFLPNDSAEETDDFLRECDATRADENRGTFECAVLPDDVRIGAVSLRDENGTGELGRILNKRYRGNGYTEEAAAAPVDYAVREPGIRHFIAQCDAENRASYRVMEKPGMTLSEKPGSRRNRRTPPGAERFELTYRLDV